MNRKELIKRTASLMRETDIKKKIRAKTQVFHISDNNGNSKDFVVKESDRKVLYTEEDVECVLGACVSVIEEALKHGEDVFYCGFGNLGLSYRKPTVGRNPKTGEIVQVEERFAVKFTPGTDLKMCSKIYTLSRKENIDPLSTSRYSEDGDEFYEESGG